MRKAFVLTLLTGCILFFANCHPKMYPTASDKNKPANETAGSNGDTNSGQIAKGKTIFESECNKCHDLPKPTEHSFNEWCDILPKMFKKAELDHDKREWVRAYVLANIRA